MSRELHSDSGRLVAVQQDDGNFVIYDGGRAVFDEWSHFAGVVMPPAPPNPGQPTPSGPITPIRVTQPADGPVVNRMYSYWSACVVRGGYVYVMVPSADHRPKFFRVHIATRTVESLGPLLPFISTGEGWYFDAAGHVYLCDGPRLWRSDMLTGGQHVIVDISLTHPGGDLWQAHSSEDGQTHSATVRRITSDGPYEKIGTVVSRHGEQSFIPATGHLDESHLTGNGAWLLIEEDNDLLIFSLITGESQTILDVDGALAHIDCGPDFAVGEDNQIGACVRLDLPSLARTVLFSTWGMGHVSVRAGRCLLSDQTHLSLVALNGAGVTPLLAHGMVGEGYDRQVHGNLSPCGTVACYVTNSGGDRMDAWIVEVPHG